MQGLIRILLISGGTVSVGLAVAGASMFLGHARVRRTSAMLSLSAVIVAAIFAPLIISWGLRGQSLEEASQLTGRTKVWSSILGQQRPFRPDHRHPGPPLSRATLMLTLC